MHQSLNVLPLLLFAFGMFLGGFSESPLAEGSKDLSTATNDKRGNPSGNPHAKESRQCSAQDISPTSGKGAQHASPVTRDASCYIDWVRAAETTKGTSSVIIDIRPADAFTRLHLPEAVNLRANEIKTKSYFAGRPLLIYGEGRADTRLDELCADLKGQGFRNVKILSGGILAWAKTEAAKSLHPAMDFRGLAELSAADLYAELRASDNLIVGVSPQFSTPEIDARRLRADGPVTPERLSELLKKANAKPAKSAARRVVLIGANALDPKVILDVLSSSRIELPVFYYAGDLPSYEAALKRLDALWSKQIKGPVAQKCGFS